LDMKNPTTFRPFIAMALIMALATGCSLLDDIPKWGSKKDAEKAAAAVPTLPEPVATHKFVIEPTTDIVGVVQKARKATVALNQAEVEQLIKAATGLTPKGYADAHRGKRVRDGLKRAGTVTEAIYSAGFNSNGRFYAASDELLGMKPTDFREGGAGATIRFAVGECSLGAILVAATDKGVCAIMLEDDPQELVRAFQDDFPKAQLVGGDKDFERVVAAAIGLVEGAPSEFKLPLDVRGTAFQQRVWQALRDIPAGKTATYSDIAKKIGAPASVRAVAGACAANKIAVAIPCHRVVRTDGSLSGYRWGVERKRALLQRESEFA